MAPVAQGMLLSSFLRRAVAASAATTSAANIAGQLQGSVASVDNVISFVLAPTGVVVFRLPGHRVVFAPTSGAAVLVFWCRTAKPDDL